MNYQRSKIYKITSKSLPNEKIISFTTQNDIYRRLESLRNAKKNEKLYQAPDAIIEILEYYPCCTIHQLRDRTNKLINNENEPYENLWYKNYNIKKKKQENEIKEKILLTIQETNKRNYLRRRVSQICDCSGRYNKGCKQSTKNHLKSLKHSKYINSLKSK